MTRFFFLSAFCLLTSKRYAAAARWSGGEVETPTCDVYLAPSAIPGAGLGMYAGRDFDVGNTVTKGDIVIPLSEVEWHNGFDLNFFLWDEYTWNPNTFTYMEDEAVEDGIQAASTGIGAAINCDLPLVNIEDTWSWFNTAGIHRAKDPGAGAFTPYHNRQGVAIKEIVAGQELYINYGEQYFKSRQRVYGNIPLMGSYRIADRLLGHFVDIRDYIFEDVMFEDEKKAAAVAKDLWDIMTSFDSRAINALPSDYSRVDEVLEIGAQWQNYDRSVRSLDWLEKTGQCMTNIYPGRSKLRQAGRGAFATNFIPKGGLVSPAPLIHIGNKDQLIMYDMLPMDENERLNRDVSKPIHQQLLLNYCFGHRNSTLLLSPYGMLSSLINHSKKKANTRLVWSSDMRREDWKDMPIGRFENEKYSGLQFDFIALRDIKPDEEIYIDYGQEWEDAWEKHVENWHPEPGSKKYMLATDMDEDINLVVRTEEEGGYGPSVVTYCHEEYRRMAGLKPRGPNALLYCRAVSRYYQDGKLVYNVEVFRLLNMEEHCVDKTVEILFGVPRDAFFFEDEKYTRDHQMTWSFRHEMMIPDDIFPKAWMNL